MSDIFNNLFGGSQNQNGFNVTGGGANAPFSYGPSLFDLAQIIQATGTNEEAMANRYNQLGLGGSTMAHQDALGAAKAGQALVGEEQVADVGNPAINPALQPPINQLIGVGQNNQQNTTQEAAGLASTLAPLALGA